MKRRLRNIFGFNAAKRGISVIIIVITAASSVSQTTASVLPSRTNNDEKNARHLANAWAEAVKNRDGKAQYALYTQAYQKEVYGAYTGLNWVTGTSSPWVERYTVELTASGATVLLNYAASTGPAGDYTVHLDFAEEGNILKIGAIKNAELILGVTPS